MPGQLGNCLVPVHRGARARKKGELKSRGLLLMVRMSLVEGISCTWRRDYLMAAAKEETKEALVAAFKLVTRSI